MSQWSITNPPKFPYLEAQGKRAYASDRGWHHPDTGELLVTIRGLATAKGGSANVVGIEFVNPEAGRGDDLSVAVFFNEKVTVTVGSTLVLTGSGGNITLKAAAQSNTNKVIYNKQNGDGTTQEVVPDRADTYTVGAQTIGGTITDVLGAVAATQTLTLTDNPTDTETVTINSKVYTFKTTLTNTDGFVKIGATKELSLENLAKAINLGEGAGTDYAAATTVHANVTAKDIDATLVITAKVAGTAANSFGTTETLANGSWGASTMAGGAAASASSRVVSSGVAAAVVALNIPVGVIESVEFSEEAYDQGDNLSVTVNFTETVDVPVGSNITVSTDAGDIVLYAAAQSAVTAAVFNKKSDNSTQEVVPTDTAASATLTNAGSNVSNADTVTIDGKVYTFQSTLTNVDGNVKIGASNTASMTNLFRAINGTGGTPGTDYAAATVAHTTVDATNPTGTTVVVTAKATGTAGNSLAVSEASSQLSWGGATLAGGITAPTELSIEDQTIQGEIVDAGNDEVAPDLEITATIAAAAGTPAVSA